MARYLLTGGCGFIGSHLVDRLHEQGHDVLVVDNLSTGQRCNLPIDVPVIVTDVQNTNAFRDELATIDGCFHLAAISSVWHVQNAWSESQRVNLTAFVKLMEAIALSPRHDIPIVFTSSAAVYGDNADLPLSEDTNTLPISAYGADKLGCEQHARVGSGIHQLTTTCLRLFNVYGPRQASGSSYSGVISSFLNRIMAGKSIEIYGDGTQTRDFIYVSDVIDALISTSQRLETGFNVFNLCSGVPTSINMLASRLSALFSHDVPVIYHPERMGDIRHSVGDPRKLLDTLGVAAAVSIDNGLQETAEWIETQHTQFV